MRSHYSAGWTLALVLLVSSLLAVSAANNRGQPAKPEAADQQANRLHAPTANTKKVSDSVTNLAAKIANALSNQKSKTEIFSPVSIAGALSLLLLGSGGQTQQELLAVMGLNTVQLSFQDIHLSFGRLFQDLVSNDPSLEPLVTWRLNDKCNRYNEDEEDEEDDFINSQSPSNEVDLLIQIGNGIFSQKGTKFDERYDKLAKDLYKSELKPLDFVGDETGSVRYINSWVHNQTHGRIADIVSHISADTILMIVNTLYFRGLWEEAFQPMATRNRRFFPNGPEGPDSFDIPMMAKSHCMPYYFWQEENVRVLGVPYRQNVTMYIFMPMNSTRQLVQSMQSKITAERVNDIVTKMKMKSVTVMFPKMHISNSISLKNVLQQLGVYTLFERNEADLKRLLASNTTDRFGGDPLDLLEVLQDTKENAILLLQQQIPDCIIEERSNIDRGECLKDHCAYGGKTCVCCIESFRRRRRRDAFTPSKDDPIFVNEMLHKVDLTVNERGTEGGAATATLIDRISSQINFIVNGPFMMLIREETTRLPLFYGNIYNPK
ncbi:AGAP009670-PB [Anopheles gambiae str. PEST]|uniref:AGAP009670-PB n=2 Tax=Anopheles gambiae TaxID=7165 RepID=Q7Q1Q9_ANOGA|nr:AGAP009670-PB [Anopheles gambiae str. PEST]